MPPLDVPKSLLFCVYKGVLTKVRVVDEFRDMNGVSKFDRMDGGMKDVAA